MDPKFQFRVRYAATLGLHARRHSGLLLFTWRVAVTPPAVGTCIRRPRSSVLNSSSPILVGTVSCRKAVAANEPRPSAHVAATVNESLELFVLRKTVILFARARRNCQLPQATVRSSLPKGRSSVRILNAPFVTFMIYP
jgi:hypothetical protein